MLQKLHAISLLFLLLGFFFKIEAQSTIAQVSTFNPSENITCANTSTPFTINVSIGQTFKSLLTATISTVQFSVVNIIQAGTVNIEIYSCSGPTTWGSLLGTLTNITVNAAGSVSVDVSGLNISVTANNYYGLRIVPNSGFFANLTVDDNVYADGSIWLSTAGFSGPNDLTFTVSGNATLPVSLVSFTAKQQNGNVLLQWNTASEQNSKDFTVQRSVDGNHWNNIGAVASHGNSNVIVNYSYTDNAPIAGIDYYRLLQTDLDGKSSFSVTSTVKFNNDNKVLTVLSNPVQSNQLRIQLTENRTVSLFTTEGRIVWKKELLPGLHTIDVSSFSKGIYLVQAGSLIERVIIK